MKTRITELFGIEHPIVGGALASISTAGLVAAQANAGILGVMVSAMHDNKESLRREIRLCKSLTNKPFAVSVSLSRNARGLTIEQYIDVVLEEDVPVIETSGRSPDPYISLIRQGKAKYMHKCARVRDAIKVESLGADAVEIVGFECGGRPGLEDISSMVIVPLTADAVSIPLVAGGGFADGRGLVAALALGADGVIMGTRFLATQECPVHQNVKSWLLEATETDTTIVQRSIRSNFRVAKNEAALTCLQMEGNGASTDELMPVISGARGRLVSEEGQMNAGLLPCGEIVGLIRDVPAVTDLVDRIMRQAEEVRQKLAR